MWICKCERRRETLTYSVQKRKEIWNLLSKMRRGGSNKESWEGERKKMSKKISVRVGAAWIKGQK